MKKYSIFPAALFLGACGAHALDDTRIGSVVEPATLIADTGGAPGKAAAPSVTAPSDSPRSEGATSALPVITVDSFEKALTPVGFPLKTPGYHLWCASPVRGPDGKIHLFVSRWPVEAKFNPGWHTACEIARYEAERPEGPWIFKETILRGSGKAGDWKAFAPHNPQVSKLADGRYALVHIANASGLHTPDRLSFPADQKIGLLLADRPEGPWKDPLAGAPLFSPPADPKVWSHDSVVGVNNPTLIENGGKFLLYYKAMKAGKGAFRRMGVAVADKVEGPYVSLPEPVTANNHGIEDGYVFRINGRICLLTRDSATGGGVIWSSDDGLRFDKAAVPAYGNLRTYLPAEEIKTFRTHYAPCTLERPSILSDPATGEPAYLFLASSTTPKDDAGARPFLLKIVPRR